jgi:hypothetical protein
MLFLTDWNNLHIQPEFQKADLNEDLIPSNSQ